MRVMDGTFLMPVEDVFSISGRGTVVTGRVERGAVSYTHLRAHETVLDLVCRLLLEKKKQYTIHTTTRHIYTTLLAPVLHQ